MIFFCHSCGEPISALSLYNNSSNESNYRTRPHLRHLFYEPKLDLTRVMSTSVYTFLLLLAVLYFVAQHSHSVPSFTLGPFLLINASRISLNRTLLCMSLDFCIPSHERSNISEGKTRKCVFFASCSNITRHTSKVVYGHSMNQPRNISLDP